MKVLIITYYWPPAGGSGVQRWLKFVKYLQDFGITPIVFTVDDGNYPKEDQTLLQEVPKGVEVLKNPIWEPTDLFFWKKKKNTKKDISNATNSGFLSFIRGNFFIPDPKVFWVNSSVNKIDNYLKNNKIDVLISTGPPHSTHLIAKKIKERHAIKWLADFRDPWTDLYYNKEFKQLEFAKRKNKKLELEVLQKADCVLTVSNALQNYFKQNAKRVAVITNGFDDEVLSDREIHLDKKFTISYIGLLPKQSVPSNFFEVLKTLCQQYKSFQNDLQLQFVGDISNDVKEEVQKNNLQENTTFKGYVTHKKAIEYQKKSQVLLLLIPNVKKSEGILTGKLFEYLTAKRPILAISSSQGDLADILNKTNSGKVFNYNDKDNLAKEIMNLYHRYQKNTLYVEANNINQYHRKKLTQELAVLLKSLTS